MTCLANLVWILLGGLVNFLSWTFVGLLWCITIVGIPIGLQCFKLARFGFAPFGKKVVFGKSKRIVLNILWVIFGGIELAMVHLASAGALAITIIGIPFALQQLKLARLALIPFGAKIVRDKDFSHYGENFGL